MLSISFLAEIFLVVMMLSGMKNATIFMEVIRRDNLFFLGHLCNENVIANFSILKLTHNMLSQQNIGAPICLAFA